MKRKIFSILFALVLVLTLSLVAAPVAAQDGVYLQTEGNGIAEWSAAQAYAGSYSVKLSAPDSDASARPVIPYGNTLSSIKSISFWTYIETADYFPGLATLGEYWADGVAKEGYLAPYITLELDTAGDSVADDWLILYHYGEDTKGEWVQRSLVEGFHTTRDGVIGQSYWHSIMNSGLMTWPKLVDMGYVGNIGTLDEWQGTSLGEATVLNIKIPLGDGPGFVGMEVYVDDITINGVLYELEPATATDSDTSVGSGSVGLTLSTIDVVAPDAFDFGTFDTGDNLLDAAGGSVTITLGNDGASGYSVTAKDQADTGFMVHTDGETTLNRELKLSDDSGSTYIDASIGLTYEGTVSEPLSFDVNQVIDGTELAGVYTITIEFAGALQF